MLGRVKTVGLIVIIAMLIAMPGTSVVQKARRLRSRRNWRSERNKPSNCASSDR